MAVNGGVGGGRSGSGSSGDRNIVFSITVDAASGTISIDGFSDALKNLGSVGAAVGKAVVEGVTQATNAGWQKLAAQLNAAEAGYTRLASAAKGGLQSLRDSTANIGTPLQGLIDSLQGGLRAVASFAGGLSNLGTPFRAFGAQIQGMINSVFSFGASLVTTSGGVGAFIASLTSGSAGLARFVASFSAIGTMAVAALSSLSTIGSRLGVLGTGFSALAGMGRSAFASIASAISPITAPLASLTGTLTNAIRSAASFAGSVLSALNPLKGFTTGLGGVGGAAAGAGTGIGGFTTRLGNFITGLAGGTGGMTKFAGQLALLGSSLYLAGQGLIAFSAKVKDYFESSVKLAAEIEKLNDVLNLTARNMNVSVGAAQAQVQAIRSLNITHREAIQTTLQFMRAQLDLADASKLTQAAQDLAVISGQNSSEALGTLIEAIQTNREMLLRQFGIVKTLPQIFEQYAQSVNRSASSLTTLERQQAILNTILTEAGKVSGAYATAMDDAAKRQTSLARLSEDVREKIGAGLVPIMLTVVKGLEGFLNVLKAVPSGAYVFIGSFVALGAVLATATAGITALATALVYLTTSEAAAAVATRALAAAFFTPAGLTITAVALGVSALAGYLIYLKTQQEGAAKAAITHAQQLQGEITQVKNLEEETNRYIEVRKRADELKGGATPTPNEEGRYDFLDQATKRQLATQRAVNNAHEMEKQLIADAALAGVDIIKYLDAERQKIIDINGLRQATLAAEKQRIAISKEDLPVIQRREQELQKAYQQEIDRNKRLHEAQANPGFGSVVTTFLYGDPFKNLRESTENSNKKVKELQDQIMQTTLDEFDRNRTGKSVVPVDVSQTLEPLSKLEAALTRIDQMQRTGVKPITGTGGGSSDIAELQDQAKGISSIYDTALRNIESIQAQSKFVKTDVAVLNTLEKDRNTILAAQRDLQIQIARVGKDPIESARAQVAIANQAVSVYRQLAQDSKATGANIAMTEEASAKGDTARLNSQTKLNSLNAEQLHSAVARLQAENTLLNARSKTAAEVDQVAANDQRILQLESSIALLGDRRTGQATVIANNAKIQADAIENLRQKELERVQIAQLATEAQQSETSVLGASLAQQISLIEQRFQGERNQLQLSKSNHAVIEAEITTNLKKEQAERLKTVVDAIQKSFETQTRIRQDLATPIQQRIQLGNATPEDIARIRSIGEEQKKSDLAQFQNERGYQELLRQYPEQAAVALAAKKEALDAQSYGKEMTLQREVIDGRTSAAEALLRVQQNAGGISQQIAEAQSRELQQLADIDKLLANKQISETEYQRLIKATNNELKEQSDLLFSQQKIQNARSVIEPAATPGMGGVINPEVLAQAQNQIAAVKQQLTDLAAQQQKDVLNAKNVDQYNMAMAKLDATLRALKEASDLAFASLDRINAKGEAAARVLSTPGTSVQAQGDAAKAALDAMHANQDALAKLNEQLEAGTISWDKYVEAIQHVGPTTPTIQMLFEAIMDGAGGSISALDALTAGFDVLGQAAMSAFEAMGSGGDIAKAVKNTFASVFKELGAMAIKRSMFWFAAAVADTFVDPPRAAAEYAAGAEWLVAAAALGIAGGAMSGGGGGTGGAGGGGANQPGGMANNLQQIAPQKTQTDVTGDNITRLSEGLVVQGRQIQAAGDKFNNLGAQLYQFINTEKQLANSPYQNQRNIADNNALQFNRLVNSGGITGPQFQALNSYFLGKAQEVTSNRDEGLQQVTQIFKTETKAATDAIAAIANQGVSTVAAFNKGTQQTRPLEIMSPDLINQFAGLKTSMDMSNNHLNVIRTNTGEMAQSFLRYAGQVSEAPNVNVNTSVSTPTVDLSALANEPAARGNAFTDTGATLNDVVVASVNVQKAITDANGKQIAALNLLPKQEETSVGDKILQGFANFETGGVFGLIGGIFNWMSSNHIADAIAKQTEQLLPAYSRVQLAVSSLSASLNEKLNGVVKQIQETAQYNQDRSRILAALNDFTSTTFTAANAGIQSTLAGIQLPNAPDLGTQSTALNGLSQNLAGIQDTLGNQFGALQMAVTNQTNVLNANGTTTNQLLMQTNRQLGSTTPTVDAATTINAPQTAVGPVPPLPTVPTPTTQPSAFLPQESPVLPASTALTPTTPTIAPQPVMETMPGGSVSAMQDWVDSLRADRQEQSSQIQSAFGSVGDELSARLAMMNAVAQNGNASTNDILKGIHEETVKFNDKSFAPVFQPRVSIDGQEVASAVLPHMTGSTAFGNAVTTAALGATQMNMNRRETGRALSSGDV